MESWTRVRKQVSVYTGYLPAETEDVRSTSGRILREEKSTLLFQIFGAIWGVHHLKAINHAMGNQGWAHAQQSFLETTQFSFIVSSAKFNHGLCLLQLSSEYTNKPRSIHWACARTWHHALPTSWCNWCLNVWAKYVPVTTTSKTHEERQKFEVNILKPEVITIWTRPQPLKITMTPGAALSIRSELCDGVSNCR